MSVGMALVDYIPVGLFIAAALLLMRDLYNKMSKGAFALFSAGTLMIMIAGIYKATWKLLYGAGICDFAALNRAFFPMQATGFVLAAAGILALLCVRQGKGTVYALAPILYESSMIFVILTGAWHAGHLCQPDGDGFTHEEAVGSGMLCAGLLLYARDGLSVFAGFCGGGDELDRAGRQYRGSGHAAGRRSDSS